MDKLLRDTLLDLGCTDKEAKFYITNYKLGPATINEIAKVARIERSTAYLIVEKLIEKGLIIHDLKRYKRLLTAIEPVTLHRMLAAKKRMIGRHEISLQDNLPDLQAMYAATHIRPRVRTYEGTHGITSILKDILATPQELRIWTNQQTESTFFTKEYHQLFIKHRIAKKIPARVLAVHNEEGSSLIQSDKSSLRQTKLLPKDIQFSAETYIYGNKIAIIDFNKDIIGIIIESETVAQAQRAIFEMSWGKLDKS